jgi:hypothetical protein
MKKIVIIGILVAMALTSVHAQGLYFDIGLGVGQPTTIINDVNIGDLFSGDLQIGFDLGVKIGYAPFDMPLYFVGTLGFIGHRIFDSSDYIQYTSYIIGGGAVYYPIPIIQVAASVGYSFTTNDSSFFVMAGSKGGFAFDLSAGIELGNYLLGIRCILWH